MIPIPGNFTLYGGTITAVSAYTAVRRFRTPTIPGASPSHSPRRRRIPFSPGADISGRAFSGALVTPPLRFQDLHITPVSWTSTVAVEIRIAPCRPMRWFSPVRSQSSNVLPTHRTRPTSALPRPAASVRQPSRSTMTPTPRCRIRGRSPTSLNFANYTVTEGANALYLVSFGNPVCSVSSPNGGTTAGSGATVTIGLKEGEDVTCTFINARKAHFVKLIKSLVPPSDSGLFDLTAAGSTAGGQGNGGFLFKTRTSSSGPASQ